MLVHARPFAFFAVFVAAAACGRSPSSATERETADAAAPALSTSNGLPPLASLSERAPYVRGGRPNASVRFDAGYAHFGSSERGHFAWKLEAVGRKGVRRTLGEAAAQRRNEALIVERAGVSERYETHRDGIEHSLMLEQRALPDVASDTLDLSFQLLGARAHIVRDGEGAVLEDATGERIAHVHDLLVKDATGRTLPSWFVAERDGELSLRISDGGATYPVTVDPTVTLPLLTTVATYGYLSVGYDGASLVADANTGIEFYSLIGGKWTSESGFGGSGSIYSNNATFFRGFGFLGLTSLNAVAQYQRGSSPWLSIGYLKTPTGMASSAAYGASITGAGSFLIAGGPNDTGACTGCSGSIANWKFPGATVSARLGPSSPETAQGFGCMVSADTDAAGNTIVAVGSCYDRGTTYVGRADIATFDTTGVWASGTTPLTQPPDTHHGFGNCLAVNVANKVLYVASDERVYAYTASGTTLPSYTYAGVAFSPPTGVTIARGGIAFDGTGKLAVGTAASPGATGTLYILDTTSALPHTILRTIASSTTGTVMGISPSFAATGIAFVEQGKATYVYDPVVGVPVGGACVSSNDCSNNNCAAGFCCRSACTIGCDASGTCKTPGAAGATCTTGALCATGTCAGGFCCSGPCPGGTCDATGACTIPAAAGGSCTTGAGCKSGVCGAGQCCAAACGTGVCDAAGACISPLAAGAKCTASAACASGTCASGFCCSGPCVGGSCDATGVCTIPQPAGGACTGAAGCTSGVCGGGHCCAGACSTGSCDTSGVCVGGKGTDPLGTTCTSGSTCASGYCVDGVCCDGACSGVCESCNQAGKSGTCSAVTGATMVSHGACPAGACTAGGALGYACDGASRNSCVATVTACGAYVCAGGACKTTCASDADCAAPNVCTAGACVMPPPPKAPSGAAAIGVPIRTCKADTDCATGHCADGVCCDSACKGKCETCAYGNQAGHCVAQPDGSDLRKDCSSDSCQSVCNGAGDCRPSRAGDQCEPAACRDQTTFVGPAVCSAHGGHCGTESVATFDCSPYICAVDACLVACSSSVDCAPGNECNLDTGKCSAAAPTSSGSKGCSIERRAPADFDGLAGAFAVGLAAWVARRRSRDRVGSV